jgi:hypothetical protein
MKENLSLLANLAAIIACIFTIAFPETITSRLNDSDNPSKRTELNEGRSELENNNINFGIIGNSKDDKRLIQEVKIKEENDFLESKIRLFFGILLVLFLFFVVASSAAENLWLRIQTKRRNLNSTLIIDKRVTIIDWYDFKKNLATYYEEGHFKKLGKLKTYLGSLNVDGEIEPNSTKGINCSLYPSNDNKRLDIYYINDKNNLNSIRSLFPKKIKKYFVLKAALKDTFKQKQDKWKIGAINYCKFLDFKIRFPKGIEVKSAKFTDENDKYIVGLQPIIKRDVSGRDTLILKVSDFDKKQDFFLSWELY